MISKIGLYMASFLLFTPFLCHAQDVQGSMTLISAMPQNTFSFYATNRASVTISSANDGSSSNSPALNQCVAVAAVSPVPSPLGSALFMGKGYKVQFFSDDACVDLLESMDVRESPVVENTQESSGVTYVELQSYSMTFKRFPQSFKVVAL